MPTPNIEDVKRSLATNDRGALISEALHTAWEEVKARYPDRGWWRRKSTTRALMWEHSVNRVMEIVAEDPTLRAVEHHDTASFIADDLILFRLKKANQNLVTSNYPTMLAGLFHQHGRDLYGHPGFQRVEIVHQLNRLQTQIDWVGVVARENDQIIWSFELGRRGGGVVPLPVPQPDTGPSIIRPILPGKKADGEQTA